MDDQGHGSDEERGSGVTCLREGDPLWPEQLQAVEAPPAALWLRGREQLISPAPRIAIVGSRAPTPYGLAQATRFGRALARAGVCVVSGLARGVDDAAHLAALESGGATVAVLGCGVDRPWPSGPTAEHIARNGLLVSEHPPGTPPRRHHFPLRNRILAALADAVLVVEAAHQSGSLITARWAADQGQHVLAVPGRVDHPMSRGVTRLIREGVTPVESPSMLLEDVYRDHDPFGVLSARAPGLEDALFRQGAPSPPNPDGARGAVPAVPAVPTWASPGSRGCRGSGARTPRSPGSDSGSLGSGSLGSGSLGSGSLGPGSRPRDPIEQAVLRALEGETLTAAEVAERTGHDLHLALAALTTLELDGAVRRGAGGLHQLSPT